jgi:hypothetical protein
MTVDQLRELVQTIVSESQRLSVAHTKEANLPVNYACIFAQSKDNFELMVSLTKNFGKVVQETAMGPVFRITPLLTDAGPLRLLKIRRPDPERPERGDADFTVSDYEYFKRTYMGKPGWRLIERQDMEMLELKDPSFSVLAYYSHPTLEIILKRKQAIKS